MNESPIPPAIFWSLVVVFTISWIRAQVMVQVRFYLRDKDKFTIENHATACEVHKWVIYRWTWVRFHYIHRGVRIFAEHLPVPREVLAVVFDWLNRLDDGEQSCCCRISSAIETQIDVSHWISIAKFVPKQDRGEKAPNVHFDSKIVECRRETLVISCEKFECTAMSVSAATVCVQNELNGSMSRLSLYLK